MLALIQEAFGRGSIPNARQAVVRSVRAASLTDRQLFSFQLLGGRHSASGNSTRPVQ